MTRASKRGVGVLLTGHHPCRAASRNRLRILARNRHSLSPAGESDVTNEASVSETARHLDLSRERVRQLEAERVIERLPSGKFDLDVTRLRYIRFLRERPTRTEKHDTLHEARTRLADLRYRKMANELVPFSEVLLLLEQITAWYVSVLEGLSGAIVQARADRVLREALRAWVFKTRTALADKFAEQRAALEKTGRATDVWEAKT